MDWYYFPLLVALIVAAAGVIYTKTPRGLVWLAGLACSFVVSVAYLRLYEHVGDYTQVGGMRAFLHDRIVLYRDWLPPSAIAIACDLCLAVSIAMFGKELWETRTLLSIVLGMILINLLIMTGLIFGWPPLPGQVFIGRILEAANYLALAVIGGTGIWQRLGTHYVENRHGHHARGLLGDFLAVGHALRTPHRFKFWGH